MTLHYCCRHCGHTLGEISEQQDELYQSVYDFLSTEERKEIIEYGENGTIRIRSICESCQNTLDQNPDYHLLEHLIQ
ncbi:MULTISPECIES: anti-sigma-F factor Fin [unclassified Bacillus (in: firmicutes)]|jgi:hypothetical protein|uniref:anti-sigma-F factor Fin n=1 Tax=unclassified Bacillus (in: firmicutes) TaxID=185979 RepID=UPI00080AE68C|nr:MULTISPECIES: anti-sigma-F factor Fin [unclassified Bacillus (in: firmicutes)]OCA88462.1 hypothetical protein A8L44_18060 [Bacillus sp. FJAT-27986]